MLSRLSDLAQPSAVQRRFLLNGVKSTAGPAQRDAALQDLGMWSAQPSPSLCYAMLAGKQPATANDRGAKSEEGQERQERLHARAQCTGSLRA